MATAFDCAAPLEADRAVATTIMSYDANADAYAKWAAGYEKFPELLQDLRVFAGSCLSDYPLLDAGCGPGRDTQFLAFAEFFTVSMDMSPALLTVARRELGILESRAAFVEGDLRALPFLGGTFGGIWACASLIHVPPTQLRGAVQELANLLAQGAPLFASFKAKGRTGWTESSSRGPVKGARWQTVPSREELYDIFSTIGVQNLRISNSGDDWLMVSSVGGAKK